MADGTGGFEDESILELLPIPSPPGGQKDCRVINLQLLNFLMSHKH